MSHQSLVREATRVKKTQQIVMHWPMWDPKVLAKGLCFTCYTLKRQDESILAAIVKRS